MKTASQLRISIERYEYSFWNKRSGERPPIGILNEDVFLPIKYLKRPYQREEFRPDDVLSEWAQTDYEFGFAECPVSNDDFIPFNAAWRAIPWLEAWCGCPVRYSEGSLAPGHWVDHIDQWKANSLPVREDWWNCYQAETIRLRDSLPEDCFLSPTILRGPSDILAAIRGMTGFYCDLCDDPSVIKTMARQVHELFMQALDKHFELIQPKQGGYGHIFGYWAPNKTIVIQEDAMGMCSPALYEEIFMPLNAEVVQRAGGPVLFHLHSTGMKHYKDILSIPGLAGLELTVESKGPTLKELVPMMRETLEQSRLILYVDHGFDMLPDVLSKLPHEGLYVIIPDRHIKSESDFFRWLKPIFRSRA